MTQSTIRGSNKRQSIPQNINQQANPEPEPQQPPEKEPLQMEIDFSKKYQEISRKEIEKDLDSLMKLLDKFACTPFTMNRVIGIIKQNSMRLRAHQTIEGE